MIHTKPTLTLLLAGFCMAAIGQSISIPEGYEAKENLRELGSTNGTGSVQTFDNRYEGVKGTPFVFSDWKAGEVYLKTKNKVQIAAMNYNCVENEIIYREPGSDQNLILNRFQVDFFQILGGAEPMTFVPVQLDQESPLIFAQVLYNRGSHIYKVYGKEFIKANYEGGYSADRRYDEYVDKADLYIMKEGEKVLFKARRSKKQFLKSFPDKEKQLDAFIKENNLDVKEDSSVVKIMQHFDML